MLENVWKPIETLFANNELFAGGAILMVAGAIFTIVRRWPSVWWSWIKRQSMVVIDIPDTDEAFEWMTLWLAQDSYAQNRARLLTVKTSRDDEDREEERPKVIFSPAPGTHYLWYRRRFMILTRERKEPSGSGYDANLGPVREYLTIRLLGRGREVALSLLEEAREHALPKKLRRIQIKQLGGDWRPTLTRSIRPLDTIILPKGQAKEILDDVSKFLDSQTWYKERGIPYRRGYMFHGPPGNGKSSMVVGLAGTLKFDIGCINLLATGMSDSGLMDAIAQMPPYTLLLMEDIDCITQGRETKSSITFSGLLNALDGVGSPEGQIVIMTTNHPEKLDPALLRPGRCDRKFEFKDANTDQKIRMFNRFYPDHNSMAARFAEVCESNISMAQLQGHFLKYRNCPEEAITKSDNIRDCT